MACTLQYSQAIDSTAPKPLRTGPEGLGATGWHLPTHQHHPPSTATTSQTAPPLLVECPTLKQLYGRWLKSKKRTSSSESSCLLAVEACEKVIGSLRLDQITRAHGDTFRGWLLTQSISSKTARMRLVWVKSLLRYAYKELELIPRQPWEGLEIQVSKEQTRRAWRDDELKQLFSQPLFTNYETPKGCKSGSDAAYWIPLIGLYTGARIGVLAQLRTEDISAIDGVPSPHWGATTGAGCRGLLGCAASA